MHALGSRRAYLNALTAKLLIVEKKCCSKIGNSSYALKSAWVSCLCAKASVQRRPCCKHTNQVQLLRAVLILRLHADTPSTATYFGQGLQKVAAQRTTSRRDADQPISSPGFEASYGHSIITNRMQKVATLLSGSRITFAPNVSGCDHTTGSEQGSELAGETKGVVSFGQNGYCVSPSALNTCCARRSADAIVTLCSWIASVSADNSSSINSQRFDTGLHTISRVCRLVTMDFRGLCHDIPTFLDILPSESIAAVSGTCAALRKVIRTHVTSIRIQNTGSTREEAKAKRISCNKQDPERTIAHIRAQISLLTRGPQWLKLQKLHIEKWPMDNQAVQQLTSGSWPMLHTLTLRDVQLR